MWYRAIIICGGIMLACTSALHAGVLFNSYTSDGTDGALSLTDGNYTYFLYTSDVDGRHAGDLWRYYGSYGYTWSFVSNGGRLVSQGSGKPDVWAWDYTTATTERPLTVLGNIPGAILATGNVSFGQSVSVQAQAGVAGVWPADGGGAGGGKTGHSGDPGSGGGGASFVHVGETGNSGGGSSGGAGGAAYSDWTVLQGGSGGGGSRGDHYGSQYWRNGGGGGGGLLVSTTGDLTITASGSIHADGANGVGAGDYSGGGGGGSGGYIALRVAGDLLNQGTISAIGGHGGTGYSLDGGDGSGGMIYLDPTSLSNLGTITVAGGNADLLGAIGLDFGTTITGGGSVTGEIATIPEPATLSLLALGGLAMLRRRK